jgi:hypothetical protein
MFRRHVDVIAVFMITLSMLALSEISNFRNAMPIESLSLRNAIVKMPSCPLPGQILSRVAYVLNR